MKKLWAKMNMTNFIQYHFSPVKDFFQKRKEAFFPRPVNFVAKELYKLERDILKASPNFLETLVTTLLILTIIVGVILAIGKKHALKKYDQFALNTGYFGEVPDQKLFPANI